MKKIILFVATLALANAGFAAKAVQHDNLSSRTKALESEVTQLKEELSSLKNKKFDEGSKKDLVQLIVEPYAHGSAVVTSPFINIRAAYDASDLMVNLPSVNEDLLLLKERQKLDNYSLKHNIAMPKRPVIVLSGAVEGGAIFADDYHASTNLDFDLTRAELDIVAEIDPAITAAMMISYENGSQPDMTRVRNSRLKLDRGFVTIGNLNKCPIYFSIGQMVLAYGDYASYMVTLPVTNILGKTKQRAAMLGYFQNGFYAQAYGFQGETHVDEHPDLLKRGGINVGYDFSKDKLKGGFGLGYIGNIAESNGMQVTGYPDEIFAGFAIERDLHKRVPAVNAHAKLAFGEEGRQLDLVAEYVGATTDFNVQDMMFNGHGAKPEAFNVEAQYEFKVGGKPSALSIGYGQTKEALAVNLPESSYYAAAHTSIWRDTIESIEFRHDNNYGEHDFARGGDDGEIIFNNESKSRNVVTAQLGVYF